MPILSKEKSASLIADRRTKELKDLGYEGDLSLFGVTLTQEQLQAMSIPEFTQVKISLLSIDRLKKDMTRHNDIAKAAVIRRTENEAKQKIIDAKVEESKKLLDKAMADAKIAIEAKRAADIAAGKGI